MNDRERDTPPIDESTRDLLPDQERPGSDMGHGYDEAVEANGDPGEDETGGPRVEDAFRSGS